MIDEMHNHHALLHSLLDFRVMPSNRLPRRHLFTIKAFQFHSHLNKPSCISTVIWPRVLPFFFLSPFYNFFVVFSTCRSHWPRALRRGSAAARLLGLWIRIQTGAWMFVFCEYCGLLGRGLCVGIITRPEEYYRLRSV
jgi:hypothetical protein